MSRNYWLLFLNLIFYVVLGCPLNQENLQIDLPATNAIVIDEVSDKSSERSLTTATIPTEVYIGFVYPQFKPLSIFDDHSDESQDYDGSQYLAAFLMAVREINNKTDGIYDDVLVNTTIKFAVRDTRGPFIDDIEDAKDLAAVVFNNTGVKVVVGAASNAASSAIAQVFNDYKIDQVAYASTGSFLSYVGPYPYYFRTCMDDAFEGYALADIAKKYYGWDIISTFSSSDSFGTDGFLQFSLRATELGIKIRSIHQFRAGTEDLTEVVNEALSFGSQVFFLFLSSKDAANLLATGYKLGLFKEGIQIIGNHAILDRETYLLLKNEYDVPVQEVLKGAVSVNQSYGDINSEAFKGFVDRWRKQNDTIYIDPYTNLETCWDDTDDDGGRFLYKKQFTTNSNYKCTGLRFEEDFESDGSNIAKFAAFAYDAVVSAAVGLNKTIYEQKYYDLTDHDFGDYLNMAMSYNYTAAGVTGEIVYRLGDNTGYGFGDREIGQILQVINFQPDLYCPINTEGGLGIVGSWDIENGHSETDLAPIYNSRDNAVIKSKPPPEIVGIDEGVQVMLIIFGVLCVLVVAISALILYTFRAKKLVKIFQPMMLGIILGGSLFCAAKLFNISARTTDATCKLDIFFGHLAFTLSFGGMLLKQWRVHMIVNSAFKKVKITTSYIVRLACGLIFAVIVYLAIYAGVGNPHASYKVYIIDKLQEGWHEMCSDTYPEFATTIYTIEAALLIYGARLCWLTKDVPDALNDSKPIAASMSVIILISGLVFPIVFLLPLTPASKTIITGVGFFLASMFTTAILILPKAYMLFQGADLDHKMNIVYPKNVRGGTKIADKEENTGRVGDSGPQYATNVKIDPASRKNRAENIVICKAEIEKWNNLLLQLQSYELNQVNTNSNSSYSKNSSAAVSSNTNPDADADEEIALVGGTETDNKNTSIHAEDA